MDRVSAEWGRHVPAAAIADRLGADAKREYRAVLVTQSETSTGVHNDVAAVHAVLGDHPALLKDAVATPAGCTVDGILELEEGGLRVTLIKAVVKASQRAKELLFS